MISKDQCIPGRRVWVVDKYLTEWKNSSSWSPLYQGPVVESEVRGLWGDNFVTLKDGGRRMRDDVFVTRDDALNYAISVLKGKRERLEEAIEEIDQHITDIGRELEDAVGPPLRGRP